MIYAEVTSILTVDVIVQLFGRKAEEIYTHWIYFTIVGGHINDSLFIFPPNIRHPNIPKNKYFLSPPTQLFNLHVNQNS